MFQKVIFGVAVLFLALLVLEFGCFMAVFTGKIGKKDENRLTVSVIFHSFCSLMSVLLCLAMIFSLQFDPENLTAAIFIGALMSVMLPVMLWVAFWRLSWADGTVTRRNLLGFQKTFPVEELYVLEGKKSVRIMFHGKQLVAYRFGGLSPLTLDLRNFGKLGNFVVNRSSLGFRPTPGKKKLSRAKRKALKLQNNRG